MDIFLGKIIRKSSQGGSFLFVERVISHLGKDKIIFFTLHKVARKKANQDDLIQMTQASYDEIIAELEHRKNVLRPQIAGEITEARELGDLRENHAYTVAMEKKEQNENRIADLEELIKKVQIVSDSSSNKVVTIGKTVTIRNISSNKERTITLVGSEETEAADPASGKVSVDSPIGKAINKAMLGDKIIVKLPIGEVEYEILKIS
ncbi:MAG: hypothetical protein Kow0081_1660 [Candidatus Dojkabacteria bacterium]